MLPASRPQWQASRACRQGARVLEVRNKRRLKIIIATIILTIIAVAVLANFSRPEKKVEHTLAHQYTVDQPQFRREMGVLLGPGITEGNHVDAYNNGVEIFPPMLEAIAAAEDRKSTLNSSHGYISYAVFCLKKKRQINY